MQYKLIIIETADKKHRAVCNGWFTGTEIRFVKADGQVTDLIVEEDPDLVEHLAGVK